MGRGRVRANPRFTQTATGVEGVEEKFTVSGGTDETVEYGNGDISGSVGFDPGGNVSPGFTPPAGFSVTDGGEGLPSVTFTQDDPEDIADFVKTSGGGGTVTTSQQGVTPRRAAHHLTLNGATAGTFTINSSQTLNWNASAAQIESAFEVIYGVGFSVAGSAGEFDITLDEAGPELEPAPSISSHALTK